MNAPFFGRQTLVALAGILTLVSIGSVIALGFRIREQRTDVDEQLARVTSSAATQVAGDVLRFRDVALASSRSASVTSSPQDPQAVSGWQQRITEILWNIIDLFPGEVDETCYLDESGVEISRVVGDGAKRSRISEHLHDARESSYFRAASSLPSGQAHVEFAYQSDEHVMFSVAAPVFAQNRRAGVLHIEAPLSTIRQRLLKITPDSGRLSIVDGLGRVVLDSNREITHERTIETVAEAFPGLTFGEVDLTAPAFTYWVSKGQGYRVERTKLSLAPGLDLMILAAMPAPPTILEFLQQQAAIIAGALALLFITLGAGFGWRSLRRWRLTTGAITVPTVDQSRLESLLAHERARDPLTGLLHRIPFTEYLGQAGEVAEQNGWMAGLALVDIDNFKLLNDSLGHAVGDRILQVVGEQIVRGTGEEMTVSRFDGDTFAILHRQINLDDDVVALAERLASAVARPLQYGETLLYLTASIGLTTSRRSPGGASAMLRDAEQALGKAKERGRGQTLFFERKMRSDNSGQLALAAELRQAIDRNELVLHYQPIHDLETGTVSAFETLVRWQHPRLGLVLPGHFLPLAESVGLIVPIGRWVLLEACQTAAGWTASEPGKLPPSVHINVTPPQIRGPFFVREVAEALVASGLEPQRLTIELSGRFTLENIDDNTSKLTALRRLGVRVAIDRFDLQSVPLDHLGSLPIDAVKVAPSFLDSTSGDSPSKAINQTVLKTLQEMDLPVVAIDIETAEQFGQVIESGCVLGQGTWFGDPAPIETFHDLVARNDPRTGSRDPWSFPGRKRVAVA